MVKEKDTTPSTPSNGASSMGFTDRDMKIIAGAIQCTKEGFTIDNTKLAAKCGFKTAESARVAWYGVKKKMDKMDSSEEAGNDAGSGVTTPPASGKKRKKGTETSGDDEEIGNGFTPVNKPEKSKKSSSAEAEGEEATPTKAKAKGGRKTKKRIAMAEELGLQTGKSVANEEKIKEEAVEEQA